MDDQGVATGFGDDEPSFVIDDELVTTAIDTVDQLPAKIAAMRAHESQIAPDDLFFEADGGGADVRPRGLPAGER